MLIICQLGHFPAPFADVEQREPPHRLAAAKLEYGGGKFQCFFECGSGERLHCSFRHSTSAFNFVLGSSELHFCRPMAPPSNMRGSQAGPYGKNDPNERSEVRSKPLIIWMEATTRIELVYTVLQTVA